MKRPLSMQLDPAMFEPATAEEKEQHDIMRESTTFFRDGMRKLFKNPLAVFSLVVLGLLVVVILFAPLVVPYGYSQIITVNGKRDRTAANMRPLTYSVKEQEAIDAGQNVFPHIFGTDEIGRDYFIRVIYGARVSLMVGLFASLIVLVIGLLYGSISGYVGGKARHHHDACGGHHLFPAGHADGHPAFRGAGPGAGGQPAGHDTGVAWQQHDQHVHRLRPPVLGGHGAPGARPDPADQEQ